LVNDDEKLSNIGRAQLSSSASAGSRRDLRGAWHTGRKAEVDSAFLFR
jgi:hypothetical protein